MAPMCGSPPHPPPALPPFKCCRIRGGGGGRESLRENSDPARSHTHTHTHTCEKSSPLQVRRFHRVYKLLFLTKTHVFPLLFRHFLEVFSKKSISFLRETGARFSLISVRPGRSVREGETGMPMMRWGSKKRRVLPSLPIPPSHPFRPLRLIEAMIWADPKAHFSLFPPLIRTWPPCIVSRWDLPPLLSLTWFPLIMTLFLSPTT